MPRTNPTRRSVTAAGLATILAAASGAYSSALADSSPAPVENGASQVKITLTGDNGGACVLDHSAAAAGPVTFAVTNKTATGITEIELMSNNRILGEKENLAPGLPTVSLTLTLGGGTEISLHAPARQPHAELYTGLVEDDLGLETPHAW